MKSLILHREKSTPPTSSTIPASFCDGSGASSYNCGGQRTSVERTFLGGGTRVIFFLHFRRTFYIYFFPQPPLLLPCAIVLSSEEEPMLLTRRISISNYLFASFFFSLLLYFLLGLFFGLLKFDSGCCQQSREFSGGGICGEIDKRSIAL